MIKIPEIKLDVENLQDNRDFKKIHDEHFIDIEEVLKPQPVAISIGTSIYKGNEYPIPYGSYGDFSCIVGASKSKKTFLKSMLLASYIGGNANMFAEKIKGHNTKDKYVIDIDTEQSEFHSQRVFRRVAEMVGINPMYYKPFSLRKLSANERLEFIDWLFNESEYKGNIGVVSIDGVADLINDVNDLELSNKVAQKLLEWSAKEQCHIITVLHRNFQSKKPTGHLGSAVLKKAETVVFVENEGEFTIVTPEYSRNQPFEIFSYSIDSSWLPFITDDSVYESKVEKKVNNKSNPNF